MPKIPDEPAKVIQYVMIFLPGFLTLGLVVYIEGLTLSEMAFSYTAVALSILIYVLAYMITGAIFGRSRRRRAVSLADVSPAGDPDEGSRPAIPTLPFLIVIALLVGFFAVVISYGYESDTVRSWMSRLVPEPTAAISSHEPLVLLLKQDVRREAHNIDERPLEFRMQTHKDGRQRCVPRPYGMWMRVTIDDEVYEGKVKYYNTDSGKGGLPLVLSPACRIDSKSGQPSLVLGPGVAVFDKDLKLVELKEDFASQCWQRLFNPRNRPPERCETPLVDGSGGFLPK